LLMDSWASCALLRAVARKSSSDVGNLDFETIHCLLYSTQDQPLRFFLFIFCVDSHTAMPLSLERTRRKRKRSSHSWQKKKKQRSKKNILMAAMASCRIRMEDGGWLRTNERYCCLGTMA
jgi:hypothetical protein